jgi:hypothetical protein
MFKDSSGRVGIALSSAQGDLSIRSLIFRILQCLDR